MVQPTRELSDRERLDWLRLARTGSVGPITFRGLIGRFGTAREALEALPEMARRGGRKGGLTPASLADAEREVAALAALGGRMVALCEPDYPEPLAAIEDAPPVLSVLGRRDLMSRRSVAVVGARNASGNASSAARAVPNRPISPRKVIGPTDSVRASRSQSRRSLSESSRFG